MFWNRKPKSLGYFKKNYLFDLENKFGDEKGFSRYYYAAMFKAAYLINVGAEGSKAETMREFFEDAIKLERGILLKKIKASKKDRFYPIWKLLALRRVRIELRKLGA